MLRPIPGLRVALALLVLAALAPAQCSAPEWRSLGQRPDFFINPNGATTWDPDGFGPSPERLVVAGGGAGSFSNVATWDGSSWDHIPSLTNLDAGGGSLTEIAALTNWNGSLIAAGDFTTIGGVAANRVARWNGSSWEPLGGGLADRVRVLATYNGDLIAGGTTFLPGGIHGGYVARWDGAAWQTFGVFDPEPLTGTVSSMVELNGELIVGGNFFGIGGVVTGSIARWNGSVWQALGPGASTWGVLRVAVHNGELIVAGSNLLNAGVVVAQNIARWDGVQFQPMGAFTGPAVRPYVTFNGDLIASGSGGVFRWDGASWYPLGPASYGGTVTTFAGELIASVNVSFVPGSGPAISRWDGAAWLPLGTAFDGSVRCFTRFQGDLVAGGYFTAANGGVGNRVARWDGAAWQPMGTGFGGSVDALTVFGGNLIAAGYFTSAGGVPVDHVARWTGSAWVPFATGPGSAVGQWGVHALAIHNGELIIGGQFPSAGGGTANGIACWNGSSWQPFGSGFTYGAANTGNCYALADFNGDLIAGGFFEAAGGVTVNSVARWDGSGWHALGSGVGFGYPGSYGEVYALAVANGQLFVGGNFLDAGGAPAGNIASWDGSAWHLLGAGVDGPGPSTVDAIEFAGADLIAGGRLWSAGGVYTDSIARWDGVSWHAMGEGLSQTGGGPYGSVNALAVYQGAVIAGGTFNRSGTLSVPMIARWSSPLPFLAVSQPGGAGSGVQVRNAWLRPGHEYYNLASLDLSPGGPGTGPYGGLSYVDVSVLLSQLSMPVGTPPFHIVSSGATATHGPYTVPPGITFEAISVDVTGGSLGCISTALRYTVY